MLSPSQLSCHALLSVLLLAACDDANVDRRAPLGSETNQSVSSEPTEAKDKVNSATQEADQRIKEAERVADAKLAAAKEQFLKLRDEFRQTMQVNLMVLEHGVSELEHKAKKANAKERTELHAKIKQIRARHEVFVAGLKQLENETAATWDETKERLEREWAELRFLLDSK